MLINITSLSGDNSSEENKILMKYILFKEWIYFRSISIREEANLT